MAKYEYTVCITRRELSQEPNTLYTGSGEDTEMRFKSDDGEWNEAVIDRVYRSLEDEDGIEITK